ncbi:MAG: V-type ATP synthase subunit I [Methanobrevibacter sp.]|jgi:V/A-type H+-transporting ATPase subunit I|nr:V-type ATP synthase subunit I [Methanobrevibacter sp.]
MFRTARMRKIKVVTLNKYSHSIVNSLHEEGIVQINDISESIQQDPKWGELLNHSKVTHLTSKLSSLLMKASGLSEVLTDALLGEVGIKDMIKSFISPEIPKITEVEDVIGEELVSKAESFLNEVESHTKVIEEKLTALENRKSEINSNIVLANKLKDFDFDLSLLNETKYTFTVVGRIDKQSLDNFKNESSKLTDKLYRKSFNDEDELKKLILIIISSEFKDEFNSLTRNFDFERIEIGNVSGKPDEIISSANLELESLENDKSQLNLKLKEIAEKYDDDVAIVKEQLEIEKDKNEIFSSFGETNKTTLLEAWVPVKKMDTVKSLVDSSTEGYSVVEVEDVGEDDSEVPVLQDNPKIAKPYEFLVGMYSNVRYNAIDPTLLVFIMFPFFFGYCLTDAFYGIMLVILGVILIRGMGKINETMGNFGKIIIACGLWTIVLGFATNGFLGDFSFRFFAYNLPTVVPAFDAFKHPENILIVAIGFGIIYENIGFLLGAINNFRYGEKKEALGSQLIWFVFELGILFLVVGFLLPSIGIIGQCIGGVLIVLTFAILIYANGFYGVMDVFSWLGNILSYARLLALCLATGGIAMTVNIIAGMVDTMLPVPYLSLILAIFIFIAGHIVNFLFQVLGAFINSLRLHYVEFFSQFFIDGKNKFSPFVAKRIITKLKNN